MSPIPSAEGESVFQVRDLTKIYRMGEVEVHALRGVDMELFADELVVLLGPSGSGKSTLLNNLGGLDIATHGFQRLPRSGLVLLPVIHKLPPSTKMLDFKSK